MTRYPTPLSNKETDALSPWVLVGCGAMKAEGRAKIKCHMGRVCVFV